MRPSAAIHHVRQIAAQGLPARQAIPAMVDATEWVVPARTRTFVWLDGQGRASDLYERQPIPQALDSFIAETDNVVARGEPSLIDMAQLTDEYGGWRRFLAHPRWHLSVMKNELFRPYGIGNNLDFPIRDRGKTIGILAVCREPGSRSFNRAEIHALLTLRAHFRHAMTAPDMAAALDVAQQPDAGVAIALLAPDGAIVAARPEGRMLLYRLQDKGPPRLAITHAPPAVMQVIRRLHDPHSHAEPPSADLSTPWGTIRVCAHTLAPDGSAIVSLQQFRPRVLQQIGRLATFQLSPRERDVALAMAGQGTSDAIAQACGLTVGAYRQVAKRIYARLGASGRDHVRQMLEN